jgi:lipopolysaccharide transport system ATP-binding protein
LKLRDGEFWANYQISFELQRGECLGLIGHNGAGKTTLLKMLNGLIKPDVGQIEMKGRVGALIALGSGFNPLLTGRENVYVAGSVLGMKRKEIDRKFKGILDFSEIGSFIDSPVQTYSSGMQVRLGFAIATAMSPDVLIADEVLAVGDVNFRVKCYNRIRNILSGSAVMLVSHNMNDILKVCSRVVVLDHGKIIFDGKPQHAIDVYNQLSLINHQKCTGIEYTSDGSICGVELQNLEYRQSNNGVNLMISLMIESTIINQEVVCRLVFFDQSGTAVAEWISDDHDCTYVLKEGVQQHNICVNNIRLIDGHYRLVIVYTDRSQVGYFLRIDQGIRVQIKSGLSGGSPYRI